LLSKALRDPSVAVAFATRVNGEVSWFDEAGRPTQRLSATGRSVVPITIDGEPVAEVASRIDFESAPALLAAVASATRLAAEHARLRAELRAQIELISASRRRLMSVADEERVNLTAQLERNAGRTMQEIRVLLESMAPSSDVGVDAAVRRSTDRLDTLERDFASLAAGLGPVALAHGGLDAALDQLAAGAAVPVTLTIDGPIAAMPPSVASTLYFVCAEAIANATKHAHATAVAVTLDCTAGGWMLLVADDGCGGANLAGGSGLTRLVDRVGAVGGRLHVDSPAGGGTRVSVVLPHDESS
jgi:signal transduction histidine kinase